MLSCTIHWLRSCLSSMFVLCIKYVAATNLAGMTLHNGLTYSVFTQKCIPLFSCITPVYISVSKEYLTTKWFISRHIESAFSLLYLLKFLFRYVNIFPRLMYENKRGCFFLSNALYFKCKLSITQVDVLRYETSNLVFCCRLIVLQVSTTPWIFCEELNAG